ncbi:hypothetical protein F183_A03840 [Bryobacterales bacterium F-183]|nr:hypothetical protein F183_A03840 [Bryobacterales bacterium F-183]
MPPHWVTPEGVTTSAIDAQAAYLVDATDLNNPTPMTPPNGYFFFGKEADAPVPGLSVDWLTEVVTGDSYESACSALGQAVSKTLSEGRAQPDRLSLSLAYSCTEGGKGVRIVREALAGIDQKWSYVIVDAEDRTVPGDQLIVAKEIWFSRADELQPEQLRGHKLKRPGQEQRDIDVDDIATRISRIHP